MLSGLLGLIGIVPNVLNTVNGITNAIANEKIAALNARTDQERVAAEERVQSLQAQRDVLIEDAKHSKADLYMRMILAAGPAVVLNKVLIWDKALGSWTGGHTDPLGSDLWLVVMVVVGFYFAASITKMLKV